MTKWIAEFDLEDGDTMPEYMELVYKGARIHFHRKPLKKESELDKIRAEIEDTLYVDSLIFGELIDFRNGKISADDVIEEFNRVTRIEVLKILDKYRVESEDV